MRRIEEISLAKLVLNTFRSISTLFKTRYLCGNIALLVLLFMSCKELDLTATNKFYDDIFWTSEERAQLVLNDAYNNMFSADYFFTNEALSDNAYIGRGDRDNAKLISSGQHNPSTKRLSDEWNRHYNGIKICHVFLNNIDKVPAIDPSKSQILKAEARFIRAFHFFQLTNWFGDVPFFDYEISLAESRRISRTPKEEVMRFVHNELSEVANILLKNDELPVEGRGRVTCGAAVALNARAYLYENNWAKVKEACEKLMDSSLFGRYGLFEDYGDLFLPENEYNQEVIFDLQFVPEQRTWGNMFDLIPLSAGARLNVMGATQELIDNYLMINGKGINDADSGYDENKPYENRDPRLGKTIVHHLYQWKNEKGEYHIIYIKPNSAPKGKDRDEYLAGSNATSTGYYLRKYFDPTHKTDMNSGLNLILIRFADVLLMYAEAKNELGEMTKTVWNKTILRLRKRAGFRLESALNYDDDANQSEMRKIIRNERRSELAMEGLRIFDILRWKTAEKVLNGCPHGARFGNIGTDNGYIRLEPRRFDPNKDYLWPIPLKERDQNPNLDQNPGW